MKYIKEYTYGVGSYHMKEDGSAYWYYVNKLFKTYKEVRSHISQERKLIKKYGYPTRIYTCWKRVEERLF